MKTLPASCLPLILGVIVLGIPACSKKAVRSGGDSQALQEEMARGERAKGGAGKEGANSSFPDTSFSGRDDANSLRGLDRNPSEERLGGNAGNGGTSGGAGHTNAMIAKADSGAAARQLAEIRAEQVASVAAGLRDVFFTYDSFSITDEGRHALSGNAEWARSNPYAQLKIEGHCDERGTSAYNLVLGEKRAKAVRNYLVELGVVPTHLSVVSYGKERPFCTEHTESCYSQNRRGHLVVKTGK
ncbi:MAG: peptidoglycan-associated lipoprotein Pal [Nitrospira sp.]|jgi:peptidoglycan-associated lipoprotein|nr:peptidoglycan-associated lipoprotein Pal [Nitrospira sp.]MDI3463558.1 Tol-Pal system peptidoglycan-associated lipoprotein PAL [Nitrospira sp.]